MIEIMETKVRIGSRLYYTDTNEYVGQVIKITKLTVWFKDLDNKITKRFPLKFAEQMLNPFDEMDLDSELSTLGKADEYLNKNINDY